MFTKAPATARFFILTACSVMLLSGCGSSRSKEDQALIDSLNQKNEQLQAQNEELKQKLSSQEAFKAFMTALAKPGASANSGPRAQTENASGTGSADRPSGQTNKAQRSFTDLEDATQKALIEDLSQLGVFADLTEKFEPYKPITRGEYVTWLYNAHNKILPAGRRINLAPQAAPFFKDLSPEHPAYKYAQALANAGYSVGYDDKTFRPDAPLTREEMIGIKVGVDCGKTFEPYRGQMAFIWKFSDSEQIDNRFTGYIHQDYYTSGTYGTNIARAFGKIGTFRPKQSVTRCEAAGTLWQFGQFEHQGGSAKRALTAEPETSL